MAVMIERLFVVFICATLLSGCGGWWGATTKSSKSKTLQRIDIVATPSITGGRSTLTLAEGNIQPFIATGYYVDGSWLDISDSVVWGSSNIKVATITPTGQLTGVAAGTTSVSATKDGITSNVVNVVVNLWVTIPGFGDFSVPDGSVRMWSDANAFCNLLALDGGGWKLPTKDDLSAFYISYPLNQVSTKLGWPNYYVIFWSSTPYSAGYHYGVFLYSGFVSYSYDSIDRNVTCIR